MYESFSFNMNEKGKAFFFDGAQRKKMIEEDWKPVEHFTNPDSHTTINRFYKLNDDSVGKYEYVDGEFIVDTSHGEIDSMAKLWTETKEFKEILKGITVSGLWYDNGNKRQIAEYRNGKKHGKCQYYYSNGNKYQITEYRKGKLHGKYQSWHNNGNKNEIAEYRNGELHGKYQFYCSNGNKCEISEYKGGKKHGKFQSWFPNGNKRQVAEYRDGKKHGNCQWWLYLGRLKEVVEYNNGKIV